MYLYSIMPMFIDHVDEICDDIEKQFNENITNCPMFSMTLVPEGNPLLPKAENMCKIYDLFKEKLDKKNIPSGILVQASMGHGYKLNSPAEFVKCTNLTDGEKTDTYCPYDSEFRLHFKNVMKILAERNPKAIMLDDDFRLLLRPGKGCTCKNHMREFNRLSGKNWSRENLWDYIQNHTENDDIVKIYIDTQRDALVGAIKEMRAGIDSVNPDIQGVICSCREFAPELSKEFAGRNNPTIVRINNGNYTPSGARDFANPMMRSAIAYSVCKRGNVDYVLAETDTCPQNRYSTSAHSLHNHFTGSIMEGLFGAKHWITRLIEYEPSSGKEYRTILSHYSGFYNKLEKLMRYYSPIGCRIPIPDKEVYGLNYNDVYAPPCDGWSQCVLDRLGLPFYFSAKNTGAVFLDGDSYKCLDTDTINDIFKGTVFMSSEIAEFLQKKGFEEYTGVRVENWNGEHISGERTLPEKKKTKTQNKAKMLIPINREVQERSYAFNSPDTITEKYLFPAVTFYKNRLGGTSIVFCGTPQANYNYIEAFSFLNETRKKQIADLLSETINIPVYYPGDSEIYFKAGYLKDGELMCAVFNIGLDPLESIPLTLNHKISYVKMLNYDGNIINCNYSEGNGTVTINTRADILTPVILFIK